MEYEKILEKIGCVFSSVPLPQNRIAPHHCEECDEIACFLQGRTRESLSQDDVWIFGETRLHLISPEAVQYYLPQILQKALSIGEDDFLENILYFLSSQSRHSNSQVALLTNEQRRVIYEFLIFIKNNRYLNVVECLVEEELEQALRNWRGGLKH